MKFAIATTASLLISNVAIAASPMERIDLIATWEKKLCSETFDASPSALWEKGVFDAQVEGRLLSPPTGRTLTKEMVQTKARSMANIFRYQGYASGVCTNGNAWMVTMPAAAPLRAAKQGWRVPQDVMQSSCRQVHAWFVPQSSGRAEELAIRASGTIDVPKDRDGTLSVECVPKRPRWLGKQVWYLAPLGQGPAAEVAHQQHLTDQKNLIPWINANRRDLGLGPLLANQAVERAASVLGIQKKIAHDRSLLKKVSDDLKAKKIHLLGENRVAGTSLAHMAWLLWNSPSHRNLLLHKDASAIGVDLSQQDGELFAVLAIASSEPITTATLPK